MWRTGFPSLTNNRQIAEKRLSCLLKKFDEDPERFEQNKDRMNEYEDQGFMRKVPKDSRFDKLWCIPHYAATESKFWIVFDCAAKFKGGELSSQFRWFTIAKIEL